VRLIRISALIRNCHGLNRASHDQERDQPQDNWLTQALFPALRRAGATFYIVNYHAVTNYPRIRFLESYITFLEKRKREFLALDIRHAIPARGQRVFNLPGAKAKLGHLWSVESTIEDRLGEITEQTGGVLWNTRTWDEHRTMAEKVIWEIGNEYRITMAPIAIRLAIIVR
jgi:hypothetical protein